MICCSNCFKDPEIKAEIERIGQKGECPICGEKDVTIWCSKTAKLFL